MRAHYLQHVSFEGLGSIEPWLKKSGYTISRTPFFESSHLPDPGEIDLLIVMGGPMSVNDEKEYPWLASEKQFIRQVIDLDKPALGVCLGAQLIAEAMGARVYKNELKEIGWYSVVGVPTENTANFRFPTSIEAFHWHGETFDLPPGAVHLAQSVACENQAFQIGNSVIGLQFHLETTPESACDIISNCREELVLARYIQTEMEMLSIAPESYGSINKLMEEILDYITGR